jgi:hypothetical protein
MKPSCGHTRRSAAGEDFSDLLIKLWFNSPGHIRLASSSQASWNSAPLELPRHPNRRHSPCPIRGPPGRVRQISSANCGQLSFHFRISIHVSAPLYFHRRRRCGDKHAIHRERREEFLLHK